MGAEEMLLPLNLLSAYSPETSVYQAFPDLPAEFRSHGALNLLLSIYKIIINLYLLVFRLSHPLDIK